MRILLFEGKVAVVTGVARTAGIGFACCQALLRQGAFVIGVDVQPMTETMGERFRFVNASVTNAQALIDGVAASLVAMGKSNVHIIVNNAAPTLSGMEADDAVLDRIAHFNQHLSVTLTGAFTVVEVCKPYFPAFSRPPAEASLASVIHISSLRALRCEAEDEARAASKAGLLGLAHAQSSSLAGAARVNTIIPGWIDTGHSGEIDEEDHDWHSVKRVGLPKDVVEMVFFLADSQKSGFITASEFVVDGGVSKKLVYPALISNDD